MTEGDHWRTGEGHVIILVYPMAIGSSSCARVNCSERRISNTPLNFSVLDCYMLKSSPNLKAHLSVDNATTRGNRIRF